MVGVAVVRIGVGLVAATLGCGEQYACLGIEDFVAHIDFWVTVAVEVGEADADGEVIVARVIVSIRDPNRDARISNVVGVQFGVLAGGHNQPFAVGQFDQTVWAVAMCPYQAFHVNLCFQIFVSSIIHIDGLCRSLAWVVAHHVEANDFGDAVVVKVADQRVDAAIDVVSRRPILADAPHEALSRNVTVAFNDVVGKGRLRQGRINLTGCAPYGSDREWEGLALSHQKTFGIEVGSKIDAPRLLVRTLRAGPIVAVGKGGAAIGVKYRFNERQRCIEL